MQNDIDRAPTDLIRGDRTVRLKWHKLRVRPGDPPFARRNLRLGLAAGASLEVDIRPLACGRFVCLHDARLEDETTGAGLVANTGAAAIMQYEMIGAPGERPLLLDELAEIMRNTPIAAAALVQLDLRATAADINGAAVTAFAAAVEGVADRLIVSGYHWDAVTRLAGDIAGMSRGYDPLKDLDAAGNAGAADIAGFVHGRAPEADTVYLYRKLVSAAEKSGDKLVARLRDYGHRVDCWTLDHGDVDAADDLATAINAGCDQITTNTPLAWTRHLE